MTKLTHETYEDVIERERIPPAMVGQFLDTMRRAEEERKWANFRFDYYHLGDGGKAAARMRVKFSDEPLEERDRKQLRSSRSGIAFSAGSLSASAGTRSTRRSSSPTGAGAPLR